MSVRQGQDRCGRGESRRAGRRASGRRRRAVRHARRHRSAHAHGAALHGHGRERGLLQRHCGRSRRRHDDDHRLRDPRAEGERCWRRITKWRGWAEKAAADYSFHVAVTWWDKTVHDDMGTLVHKHGVNSFKHFMAYKNAIMADDEVLVNSFTPRARARRPADGARGERRAGVSSCSRSCWRSASPAPRATCCRVRRRSRARRPTAPSRSPACSACPIYIVHVSCRQSLEAITRARCEGQRVYGECWPDIW